MIELLVGQNQMLYIDPAATSVLISSLTAVGVAVGATAIILWRKFKKKASQVLRIDENANKEVEDELVVTDDTIASAEAPATEETAEKEAPAEEPPVEEAPSAEPYVVEEAVAEEAPAEEAPAETPAETPAEDKD